MKRLKGGKAMLHTTSLILVALIVFEGHALADRGYYTFEMVENADIIGIWSKESAIDANGSVSLGKPEVLLKGNAESLPTMLDSSTTSALREFFGHLNAKDDQLILFVGLPHPEHNRQGKAVFLLRQSTYNRYSEMDTIHLKALKRIIDQVELAQRWPKLTPRLMVEYADIIVSGHVTHEASPEDSNYVIHVDRIYRGVCSSQRLEVLPALQKADLILPGKLLSSPEISFKTLRTEINEGGGTRETVKGEPTGRIKGPQGLFFIQMYYGTGPEYLLMGAVDVNKAGQYMNLMR
jgi:hypothetical protein